MYLPYCSLNLPLIMYIVSTEGSKFRLKKISNNGLLIHTEGHEGDSQVYKNAKNLAVQGPEDIEGTTKPFARNSSSFDDFCEVCYHEPG